MPINRNRAVCTYDNPATMMRECWIDGKIFCAYSIKILPPYAKYPIPAKHFFFGANVGPWETGRIVGDKSALPPEEIHYVRTSDL